MPSKIISTEIGVESPGLRVLAANCTPIKPCRSLLPVVIISILTFLLQRTILTFSMVDMVLTYHPSVSLTVITVPLMS